MSSFLPPLLLELGKKEERGKEGREGRLEERKEGSKKGGVREEGKM